MLVSFEGVGFGDSGGSTQVRQILDLAHPYDVEFRLARVMQEVVDVLAPDGVTDELGAHGLLGNVHWACADRITPASPCSPDGRASRATLVVRGLASGRRG